MSDFDDVELDDIPSEEDSPAEVAPVETMSVSARQKIRDQLQKDIEEFMKRGGQVQQIADNVRADPPRKPVSDYGSSPI